MQLSGPYVGGCYVPTHLQNHSEFISFMLKKKWENWERQWLYMETANDSELLCLPQGPPAGNSS